eukprot:1564209-Prymnesium_polylepis.2
MKADSNCELTMPFPQFVPQGAHVDESSELLYANMVTMLNVETVEKALHSAGFYADIAKRELRPRPGVNGVAGWLKAEWFRTEGEGCAAAQGIHCERRTARDQPLHHLGPTLAAARRDSRRHSRHRRQGLAAEGVREGAGPRGLWRGRRAEGQEAEAEADPLRGGSSTSYQRQTDPVEWCGATHAREDPAAAQAPSRMRFARPHDY